MPRVLPVYTDFFFGPLTEDVEELLARFQQSDSVRYELFSSRWREMRFSDVFTGLTSVSEMRRFCRVALATAVNYFLPPYSYQIRVGGLYLMFAFYHQQPAAPPVKIRLALKDWADVQKFLKHSVEAEHYDVAYVYHSLVASKAFHYTAMQHFLTFQKQRNPKKEPMCAEFLGRATAVQELITADVLEEMSNVQEHYETLKKAALDDTCRVAVSHSDFVARLKGAMSEFVSWQQKNFSQDNKGKHCGGDEVRAAEEEPGSTRAKLLYDIKSKSYGNFQEATRSRRHRQAETVESSSSGAEQVHESAGPQKKRPPSLRARTWRSLGMVQEEKKLQAWLLSVPEQEEERFSGRKRHREAP